MKQYIAKRATVLDRHHLRTDPDTVLVGTDMHDLLSQAGTDLSDVVAVWTYDGSSSMDTAAALSWTEMVRPSFVYVLAAGEKFILASAEYCHSVDKD